MHFAREWRCRDRILRLDRARVMGILNVTPDSFSDGGRYESLDTALAHAREMIRDGADVIDVGGESTRPGAEPVGLEEELDRVIPVVRTLVNEGMLVSVDTSKPEVMREAIEAGAQIINDVRAFTVPGALSAVAKTGVGCVIMHFRATPKTMQNDTRYGDVVREVADFLSERKRALLSEGIGETQIALDPGFGFAKTFEQNLTLLERLDSFADSRSPLLVGVSRKSFIGTLSGISDPDKRVKASVEVALQCVSRGARILRVHDVKETVSALRRHVEQQFGKLEKHE